MDPGNTTTHASPTPGETGGAVEPTLFQAEGRSLFGCLYKPATANPIAGVVLCNPIGHEYIRCHRTCRQLAIALNKAGVAVLRFDYYGTGDSAGESHEAELAHWESDTAHAVEHLRRTHGVPVCVVGLRFGATVAWCAGVAASLADQLVLCDPVVNGSQYLEEQQRQHHELAVKHGHPDAEVSDRVELMGHDYAQQLIEQMRRLDLAHVVPPAATKALLLHNASDTVGDLEAVLRSPARSLSVRSYEGPRVWLAEPFEGVVPIGAIRTIVEWIKRNNDA